MLYQRPMCLLVCLMIRWRKMKRISSLKVNESCFQSSNCPMSQRKCRFHLLVPSILLLKGVVGKMHVQAILYFPLSHLRYKVKTVTVCVIISVLCKFEMIQFIVADRSLLIKRIHIEGLSEGMNRKCYCL